MELFIGRYGEMTAEYSANAACKKMFRSFIKVGIAPTFLTALSNILDRRPSFTSPLPRRLVARLLGGEFLAGTFEEKADAEAG